MKLTASQIKHIRQELGITQKELADVLRLAPKDGARTVRYWEQGNRKITGPASLALELYAQTRGIEI